jgi:hypothetical protein
MHVSTDSVKRYVDEALRTESRFPSSITPERVAELRQIQAEELSYVWQKLHESFEASVPKDATIRARLAEASVRVSERLSRLYGIDQPLKIQEESLRLQVSKSETNIKITWDQNLLAPPVNPVPGLIIGGRQINGLNGDSKHLGSEADRLDVPVPESLSCASVVTSNGN